jgi:hypothetical protein
MLALGGRSLINPLEQYAAQSAFRESAVKPIIQPLPRPLNDPPECNA